MAKSKNGKKKQKKAPSSWFCGRKGVNRVRIFRHRKSGLFHIEWYESGADGQSRPRTQSTGTDVITDAQTFADAKAAALGQRAVQLAATSAAGAGESESTSEEASVLLAALSANGHPAPPLYMSELFEKFEESRRAIGQHRTVYTRTADKVTAFFDAEYLENPAKHPRKSVDALDDDVIAGYIHRRLNGGLVVRGRILEAVRVRPVEEELTILRTALRWAVGKKLPTGHRLLTAMPVEKWNIPTELDPHRPRLDKATVQIMIEKAWALDPRIYVTLVLTRDTGHRLSSVRQLDWADFDVVNMSIRWRAKNEKNRKAHYTPLTQTSFDALNRYAASSGSDCTGPLFPGRKPGSCLDRGEFYAWLTVLKTDAGVPKGTRVGFHSFRRDLASELSLQPLAVVKSLGGWKHPQVVVDCYQELTLAQMRAVLAQRATPTHLAAPVVAAQQLPAAPAPLAATLQTPTPTPTPSP